MYRYSDCPTDRNCVFCSDVVENEDHFLLVCPLYTDLRNRFLEQKGAQSLQDMLQWKDTKRCLLLSKFTFKATNRRKLYIKTYKHLGVIICAEMTVFTFMIDRCRY